MTSVSLTPNALKDSCIGSLWLAVNVSSACSALPMSQILDGTHTHLNKRRQNANAFYLVKDSYTSETLLLI